MSLYNQAPIRGSIAMLDKDQTDLAYAMDFQFNPTTIRRTVNATWVLQTPPGGYRPIPMYSSHGGQGLSMELLLYSREEQDGTPRDNCRKQMAYLEMLCTPALGEDEDFSQFVAPPLAFLELGPRGWWIVCQSVSFTEEQFDLQLNPVRARASLTMSAVLAGQRENQEADEIAALQADGFAATNVFELGGTGWVSVSSDFEREDGV